MKLPGGRFLGLLGAGARLALLRSVRLYTLPLSAGAFWALIVVGASLSFGASYALTQAPRAFNLDAVQTEGWNAAILLFAAWLVCRGLERPALFWPFATLHQVAALYIYLVYTGLFALAHARGVDTLYYWWLFAAMVLWSAAVDYRILRNLAKDTGRARLALLAALAVVLTSAPSLVLNYADYWQADLYADARSGAKPLNAESLLFEQRQKIATALGELPPERSGQVDLFFVGFAPDGSQNVFLRELYRARQSLEQRFAGGVRSLLLINNRVSVNQLPLATTPGLEATLRGLKPLMGEEDVLFLYLTGHGSQDHKLSASLEQLPLRDLSARRLGKIVRASGIRWKVVVVSACYSGGFLQSLQDETTLVLTAARADRNSFGCGDDQEMTYFGRALFDHGLAASNSIAGAFELARNKVAEWEEARGFTPSEPQIAPSPKVEAQLRPWFAAAPAE